MTVLRREIHRRYMGPKSLNFHRQYRFSGKEIPGFSAKTRAQTRIGIST
jgi:hypothetical protein